MSLKIVTVVGARPQFIKAAAVSRVIRANGVAIEEVLVHTGQHYDENMSKVFFDELDIPEPRYNLEVAGGGHGAMTGRMLEAIEAVILKEKPNCVLVYGDTNSTLAGALAAVKLHIPLAHVEAGLRSFNMRMPEEVNRVVTDRVSDLLFCPTEAAVQNLRAEGVTRGVHNTGDVMYDVALFYRQKALSSSSVLDRLSLREGHFILATCHRAENTDDSTRLSAIARALGRLSRELPVVLPLHPRTRKVLADLGLIELLSDVTILEPLPFLDMIALEQAAKVILTDSGGIQKEAFFYRVPCVTMRDETEWVETVASGWNRLVGADEERIVTAVHTAAKPSEGVEESPYGRGDASQKIVQRLLGDVSV